MDSVKPKGELQCKLRFRSAMPYATKRSERSTYSVSIIVKPRFWNTIRSGGLFENRFVRKSNHIFPFQIIEKILICSINQKNNLFTWLHYTRGGQLLWPAGRIAVMEAS